MGLVALAAVFYALLMLLAGLSKLDGWGRWRSTVAQLLPRRRVLGVFLRRGLPLAELTVAVLLVVQPRIGFIGATILLCLLACGVLKFTPAHGGTECRCFGAFAASRISPALAYRNFVLAVGSLAAAVGAFTVNAKSLTYRDLALMIVVGLAVALFTEFRQFSARSSVLVRR